jgi:hypothetical protein
MRQGISRNRVYRRFYDTKIHGSQEFLYYVQVDFRPELIGL